MSKVKYIVILLHLSTFLITTRSHATKTTCISLIDTYIGLLLKKYPNIQLPTVTYEELTTMSQGTTVSVPQIPNGGIGILRNSKSVNLPTAFLEELRHFQSAAQLLMGTQSSSESKIASTEENSARADDKVEIILHPIDITPAQTSGSKRPTSQRKWLNGTRIKEKNTYGGSGEKKFVSFKPVLRVLHQQDDDQSSSGHVSLKPEADKLVVLKPNPELGAAKRTDQTAQNSFGGNLQGPYSQTGSISGSLAPFQNVGNQNGVMEPLGTQWYPKEQHKEELEHHPQVGMRIKQTVESNKEEIERHHLGGHIDNQMKDHHFPSSDKFQNGDLGFYMAGGEVNGNANQGRETKRISTLFDEARIINGGFDSMDNNDYMSGRQDGLEVIEPGGMREVVKGGQKVLISNTNCPDNSELCIKIQ